MRKFSKRGERNEVKTGKGEQKTMIWYGVRGNNTNS